MSVGPTRPPPTAYYPCKNPVEAPLPSRLIPDIHTGGYMTLLIGVGILLGVPVQPSSKGGCKNEGVNRWGRVVHQNGEGAGL